MARLAGQFAGILRVGIADDSAAALSSALAGLERRGLKVVVHDGGDDERPAGLLHLALELDGADQPGMVHAVSRVLAERDVNVDELETTLQEAPMTGEPLFRASFRLRAPAHLDLASLQAELETLAHDMEVELTVGLPADPS